MEGVEATTEKAKSADPFQVFAKKMQQDQFLDALMVSPDRKRERQSEREPQSDGNKTNILILG